MKDDRDFIGYGASPPDPQWPGGARIAVNINLNFEGGGERSVMEGDGVSEGVLNDIGMPSLPGVRSPIVESVFRIRLAGRRLAPTAPVSPVWGQGVPFGSRQGGRTQPGTHTRLCRGRTRDRQPRLPLARLPDHPGRGRARACPPRHRDDRAYR